MIRYPFCPSLAICLIWGSIAFAQSSASSTPRGKETPASQFNTQDLKAPHTALGGIDVLSDTMGIDFSPYLQQALKTVRQNWYHLAPASARAPKMMRGEVSIEFAILKNGKIKGMNLVEMTVDPQMGNAAWHSITDSRFPPLAAEFSGPYLALRLKFLYNPAKPSHAVLQYRE